jgi:circadian clock protein KaiC
MDDGLIAIQQVDPAELSPGEFTARVRLGVESADQFGRRLRVVIIDSLNGYLNAMPEEKFLTAQLHELLSYLGQQGIVTLLTVTQTGMTGGAHQSPVDTTYLADNVILFRYFEARGRVRRALSVVKKRNGMHEPTIRELHVTARGLEISEPLEHFQGVLTGNPTYVGEPEELLERANDE